MTAGQIILYAVIAFIILIYVRAALRKRSIKQYTPSEVASRRRSTPGQILLLDVRSDAEWKSGHLKGAVHIPLHQLKTRGGELQKYKNREIVSYCQSGNRSLTAALVLKHQGYTVAHMKGGLVEWNLQGLS